MSSQTTLASDHDVLPQAVDYGERDLTVSPARNFVHKVAVAGYTPEAASSPSDAVLICVCSHTIQFPLEPALAAAKAHCHNLLDRYFVFEIC